jgi:hypothetical protein
MLSNLISLKEDLKTLEISKKDSVSELILKLKLFGTCVLIPTEKKLNGCMPLKN